MDIAPQLRESLITVGCVMAYARDPWWIIASAAAALHGARPITVGDVDVLLSPDDACRILPGLGLVAKRGTGSAIFQSDIFATWMEPPLPVEFMAGFRRLAGAEWVEVEPRTCQRVMLDDVTLNIPERAELQAMFESFARPKDIERAGLLAALP